MATRRTPPSRPRRRPATTPRTRPPKAAPAGLLRELGVLRVALVVMALLVMIGAPKPGTAPVLEGWGMWTTLLAPTLAPILFMVLMLDALMGWVMRIDAKGVARDRYRRIVTVNLVTGIALVVWWAPYFAALFRA